MVSPHPRQLGMVMVWVQDPTNSPWRMQWCNAGFCLRGALRAHFHLTSQRKLTFLQGPEYCLLLAFLDRGSLWFFDPWNFIFNLSFNCYSFLLLLFCLFVFCFLGPHPQSIAHGGSQARGLIRATAASLTTATVTHDLNHVWDLHRSSLQCQILNPLRETRDQTHNHIVPSQIHFHRTTTGTQTFTVLKPFFSILGPHL